MSARAHAPRYQAELGNALAGEALLPMEGVSAGGSRDVWILPVVHPGEAKLRGQLRYQVQLGNETSKEPSCLL